VCLANRPVQQRAIHTPSRTRRPGRGRCAARSHTYCRTGSAGGGPTAPIGETNNWLQTIPGKGWVDDSSARQTTRSSSTRPGGQAKSNPTTPTDPALQLGIARRTQTAALGVAHPVSRSCGGTKFGRPWVSVSEGKLRGLTNMVSRGARSPTLRRCGSGAVRSLGHGALNGDQYEGRVFDDYDEAGDFAQAINYPTLIGRVGEAAQSLADRFIGWTPICWRASLQIRGSQRLSTPRTRWCP
jgi:hypothetical protein